MSGSYVLTEMDDAADPMKLFKEFGRVDADALLSFSPPPAISNAREKAVAENALFLRFVDERRLKIPDRLLLLRPFDDAPPLRLLASASDAAVAAFPLDTTNADPDLASAPVFCRIWLFKGLPNDTIDHSARLQGVDFQDELKCFLSISEESLENVGNVRGRSWMLAAELAETALTEPDIKAPLATAWMTSGVVEGRKVKEVQLGNKLNVYWPGMKWLLPLVTRKSVPERQFYDKNIKFADSMDSAVAHIKGVSTGQGAEMVWPDEIDEMHVLIGENLKAPFQPVLLTRTAKISLWPSSETRSIADAFAEIIKSCLPTPPEVAVRGELSTSDIQKTERILIDYFQSATPANAIFNITSGNRMMGMGAETVAKLFPEVLLVYKDFSDKRDGVFVYISHREKPPCSGSIVPGRAVEYLCDWEFLNGKIEYDSPDDFVKKLSIKSACAKSMA